MNKPIGLLCLLSLVGSLLAADYLALAPPRSPPQAVAQDARAILAVSVTVQIPRVPGGGQQGAEGYSTQQNQGDIAYAPHGCDSNAK